MADERKLQLEKGNLQTMIHEEEEKRESLIEEQAYRQTKQYIEEVAREKLGLVKPDDVIIRDEN